MSARNARKSKPTGKGEGRSLKKHERARMLAEAMSPSLYSVGSPPKKLNDLFLRWIETHDVPSYREIQDAMKAKRT